MYVQVLQFLIKTFLLSLVSNHLNVWALVIGYGCMQKKVSVCVCVCVQMHTAHFVDKVCRVVCIYGHIYKIYQLSRKDINYLQYFTTTEYRRFLFVLSAEKYLWKLVLRVFL